MIIKTPTKYFMTTGHSEGFKPLNAFDGALINAGVGNTNLVKMSSICPPHAEEIPPVELPQGALVPVAYASISSSEPGEVISAGVAIAIPKDKEQAGLIMEYAAKAGKQEVEQTVRKMAEYGMKMRRKEIKEIKSIAIEHIVDKCGCAFAAVVLWD
ncbi:MAG: arginine decarboxylase, pyruvoyl-dependent [Deltaproteobacteria bacterium]|nr:arginine decarboxylase, pyruvoyl-dependent [Deltaproteobacteria bacterium]